jgi:hypothetical protein
MRPLDRAAKAVYYPVMRTVFRVSLLVLFLTVSSLSVFTQERSAFFAGGLAETAFFSDKSLSYGGGLVLGCDGGAALGLRAACFTDPGGIVALEFCAFFRLYLPRLRAPRGLFLQINAGSSIYGLGGLPGLPSLTGMFSAGIQAGWRFVFKERFYLEPAVRAGYPYIAGAGLSAGCLF